MKTAVLCIGDELLKGATINTNLAEMGGELLGAGILVSQSLIVKDEQQDLRNALDYLLKTEDLIITSGGLGPTADDLTKEAVAEYLGLKLYRHPAAAAAIEAFWRKRKRGAVPDRVMKQAMTPAGAELIPNEVGTAPGLFIRFEKEGKKKYLIMLPGPPRELMPMFLDRVLPLIKKLQKSKLLATVIYTAGLPESVAEEKIQPLINNVKELGVAYCASPEGLRIFLTSENGQLLKDKEAAIRALLKDFVLTRGQTVSEEVFHLLLEQKATVATAESCTGGLLAAAITDWPGASAVFVGSVVAYSNTWKEKILGVKPATLARHGAVSAECARQMLEGLTEKFPTDVAIAVTGVAGPDGGTEQKPVGLVYIGVRYRAQTLVKEFLFPSSREMVRRRAVATALFELRNLLVSGGKSLKNAPSG